MSTHIARVVGTAICLFLFPAAPVVAAACSTSGPASGAFTVTVCIDEPFPEAVVTGSVPVAATVTVSDGRPVTKVVFSLNGQYVLTDFSQPYAFELPSDRWADGQHVLGAAATVSGYLTPVTSLPISTVNPVGPPVRPPFTPTAGTTPAEGAPFVVAAVGDGASGHANSAAVGSLIASWDPNLFLYLGDVYERGTETEFLNWYGDGDGDFGGLRSITNPAVGNHEYSYGAPGYRAFWGNPPWYYSVDAGGWHLVSLNTDPRFGQLQPGSAQYEWLKQVLASSAARCTIVFQHHPTFSVGAHGTAASLDPLWKLESDAGVDIALTGHDHNYQRWKPLDRNGQPSADGLTQFVAGSGGRGIARFSRTDSRLAFGYDLAPGGFGALRLELGAEGAAYRFENTAGTTLDAGTVPCRDPDAPPPPLFADGFESGNLVAWSSSGGMAVQSATVFSGTKAARAVSTGSTVTWAARELTPARPELRIATRFRVASQSTVVNLFRLQTAGGAANIVTPFLGATGALMLRNDVAAANVTSTIKPAKNAWHLLELRVRVAGAGSEVETWLDGTRIAALSKTLNLGTTPMGRLLLGDRVGQRSYDVAFDEVEITIPS